MYRVVNCRTGEVTTREQTAEEAALRQAVVAPTREEQKSNRAAAYVAEADPLFFQAQRGEATMDQWTAKVAEIRSRYPYPGDAE